MNNLSFLEQVNRFFNSFFEAIKKADFKSMFSAMKTYPLIAIILAIILAFIIVIIFEIIITRKPREKIEDNNYVVEDSTEEVKKDEDYSQFLANILDERKEEVGKTTDDFDYVKLLEELTKKEEELSNKEPELKVVSERTIKDIDENLDEFMVEVKGNPEDDLLFINNNLGKEKEAEEEEEEKEEEIVLPKEETIEIKEEVEEEKKEEVIEVEEIKENKEEILFKNIDEKEEEPDYEKVLERLLDKKQQEIKDAIILKKEQEEIIKRDSRIEGLLEELLDIKNNWINSNYGKKMLSIDDKKEEKSEVLIPKIEINLPYNVPKEEVYDNNLDDIIKPIINYKKFGADNNNITKSGKEYTEDELRMKIKE